MRIAVVGTSGSGKTTLARQIAERLAVPFIELDAINWQPGWRALNTDDPVELRKRVDQATRGLSWVVDGNYGSALGTLIPSKASHLVWLDYDRGVVMARVIRRSFHRAFKGTELWPGTGNRERWQSWLRASHPIRWAWSTWARRRAQYEAMISDPSLSHLQVVRLRHPREADLVMDRLRSLKFTGDDTST
jgi:adenylate kinase family enzyme